MTHLRVALGRLRRTRLRTTIVVAFALVAIAGVVMLKPGGGAQPKTNVSAGDPRAALAGRIRHQAAPRAKP